MALTKAQRNEAVIDFLRTVSTVDSIKNAIKLADVEFDFADFIEYFKKENAQLAERAAKEKVRRAEKPRKPSAADIARAENSEKGRKAVVAALTENRGSKLLAEEILNAAGALLKGASKAQVTTYCTQLVKAGEIEKEVVLVDGSKRTVYFVG